jgi:hypothetical protein
LNDLAFLSDEKQAVLIVGRLNDHTFIHSPILMTLDIRCSAANLGFMPLLLILLGRRLPILRSAPILSIGSFLQLIRCLCGHLGLRAWPL